MQILEGHIILIVESAIGPFVLELQRALADAGAETLVARDAAMALDHNRRFAFSLAAISAEHGAIKEALDLPVLLYGPGATERDPVAIVAGLTRLVAGGTDASA